MKSNKTQKHCLKYYDYSVTKLLTLTELMTADGDEDDDDGLLLSVGEHEPGWERNASPRRV